MATHDYEKYTPGPQEPEAVSPAPRRRKRRPLFVALGIAGGLALLVVALLTVATFWLTPSRLSELIGRESAQYLVGEVKVENPRFTLWSTFPRFCLQTDSITVLSRSLTPLSPAEQAALPPDADLLASAASFKGGINLLDLLRGRIRLHDVEVVRLRLNMVSVNDSVANFFITPPDSSQTRTIPVISANRIRLIDPQPLSYVSVASDFYARLDLSEMGLREVRRNTYDLTASGHITAIADSLRLLNDFPFTLGGDIALRFKPFGMRMHDYSIALGNIRSHVSLNLDAGSDVSVDDFSYSIDSFHVMRLLEYLPEALIPHVSGLQADLTVNAKARLLTPFNLSSGQLPTVEVDFNVPDGNLVYMLDSVQPLSLRHIGMRAKFLFDGADPGASYIDVPRFDMTGQGVDIALSGRVTDLLDSLPLVNAEIDVKGDLPLLSTYLPSAKAWKPTGEFATRTLLDFRMSTRGAGSLSDLTLRSEGVVRGASVTNPSLTASADSVRYSLRSRSKEVSPVAIRQGLAALRIDFDGVKASSDDLGVTAKRVTLLTDSRDSVRISRGSLSTHLQVKAPTLTTPSVSMRMGDIAASLSVDPAKKATFAPDPRFLRSRQPDARWLDTWLHTPETLVLTASEPLRSLLERYDIRADLSGSGADMRIRHFGPGMQLGAYSFSIVPDSVDIRKFSFTCGRTSASLSGHLTGLRRALLAPGAQLLRADLDMVLDTLDINQLARALSLATGGGASSAKQAAPAKHASIPPHDVKSAPVAKAILVAKKDTMPKPVQAAILLPRNLDASIHIKGRETIYTNLHLSDLRADLRLRDGNMEMPYLRLGSDFGTADLRIGYYTSDIERMGVLAQGALDNVILTTFFKKFQTLEEMWPSLHNVSGIVSLGLKLQAHVYPDMKLDMASMTGDVYANGEQLEVKQNDFIHHVARMMLIDSWRPIHIHNLSLYATIHDNLLEIYPFNFEFESYKLRAEGVNNFAGMLDYHIGVLHSPIPFHFGIDIEGTYHHPKLRFGRAGWDSHRATAVTDEVMKSFTIDLVKDVTWFGREFMHKAAVSPE